MDDRENDKFKMRAKVNGKEKSAKRMNGAYYYYNDMLKKWSPVSKSLITFTERSREEQTERANNRRKKGAVTDNNAAPSEND